MGVKRVVALSLLVAATAALAHAIASYSIEMAWLIAQMIPLIALIVALLDLFVFHPPVVRQTASKPLLEILNETVSRLPETEDALKQRLRELLIRRLAARTGSSLAEAEARAQKLVKDEQLIKLLKGEVKLRSESDVLDLLRRIDEL